MKYRSRTRYSPAGKRSDHPDNRRNTLSCIEAAETLSKDYGIEAEVIDARTLVPFNYKLVLKASRKQAKSLFPATPVNAALT